MIDELALAVLQIPEISTHQHQIIEVMYASHNGYEYTYSVLIGVEVLARYQERQGVCRSFFVSKARIVLLYLIKLCHYTFVHKFDKY